uniref:Potassium voltage-gated channel subfamily E regulatory subunit 4 n=1 Tax=Phasianus colchicus TaxID=9054 RepID=A0A669PNV1_PHACC
MLKMDHANITQAMLNAESRSTEKNNSNEYFYILIVMSFYGIFLIGIMLGYMKSKRKEKTSNFICALGPMIFLRTGSTRKRWYQSPTPNLHIIGMLHFIFTIIISHHKS